MQGRENTLIGISAPNKIVVHQNETVSTYITLHNRALVNQEFTINSLEVPEMLSIQGLPHSELLVPNHLRQIVFGVKATANASFQNTTITFSVTSNLDTEINETVAINVMIAPRSNLKFGATGNSEFTVDEKVRTSFAVNITNDGMFSDNVSFNLYSPSGWTWGWNMPNVVENTSYKVLQPTQLVYVNFWIDVPAVENGAPLAGTGPRFELSATSSLDLQSSFWYFDLQMNERKNVSIDEVGQGLVLAPNQDGRLYVTLRNVGNTPNTLNITLQPVNEQGVHIPNSQPSDRFNQSGWIVALFGGLEDVILQPNESRVIEIGFQAPNEFSGTVYVELQVFPTGGLASRKTTNFSATIQRTTGADITYTQIDCLAILPNQTCSVTFTAQNTGNSYNSLSLRVADITDGFNISIPPNPLLLQANQIKSFPSAILTIDSRSLAFTTGEVSVELLGDSGEVLNSITVPLKVGPQIFWSFRNVEEQTNAKGIMSIAMEVRNDGNAEDGLIVQLQSDHVVDMGFYPPDGAIFEAGEVSPRSFEINDIPLGSNFTIRAWVQLPRDQINNGSVYINTTIRSRYAPESTFVYTSIGHYLGKQWQPVEQAEEKIDWGALFSTSIAYLKAWSGILFSILLAGVILYKAVIDRENRMKGTALLPYQEPETAQDWMKQFQRDEPVEEISMVSNPLREPLQPVPKETYEAMFRHTHGAATIAPSPVEKELVGAASIVLDKRTEEKNRSMADDLLASLQSGQISKPMDTSFLDMSINSETHDTTQYLAPKKLEAPMPLQPTETTTSTTKPSTFQPDDDLEF